jgi:hypothetical protein
MAATSDDGGVAKDEGAGRRRATFESAFKIILGVG